MLSLSYNSCIVWLFSLAICVHVCVCACVCLCVSLISHSHPPPSQPEPLQPRTQTPNVSLSPPPSQPEPLQPRTQPPNAGAESDLFRPPSTLTSTADECSVTVTNSLGVGSVTVTGSSNLQAPSPQSIELSMDARIHAYELQQQQLEMQRETSPVQRHDCFEVPKEQQHDLHDGEGIALSPFSDRFEPVYYSSDQVEPVFERAYSAGPISHLIT